MQIFAIVVSLRTDRRGGGTLVPPCGNAGRHPHRPAGARTQRQPGRSRRRRCSRRRSSTPGCCSGTGSASCTGSSTRRSCSSAPRCWRRTSSSSSPTSPARHRPLVPLRVVQRAHRPAEHGRHRLPDHLPAEAPPAHRGPPEPLLRLDLLAGLLRRGARPARGCGILFVRGAEWQLDEEAGRSHYPFSSWLGDAVLPGLSRRSRTSSTSSRCSRSHLA